MNDSPIAVDRETLLADLTELVQALDRRTPALKSAGEARVAEDAAGLRRQATLRIMELELIEPSLWLQHSPDNGASFAAAIRRRLRP